MAPIFRPLLLILFSFLVLSKASSSSLLHPFYVSVTEINYNAKNKNLEISCKMFSEDMENILKQKYKVPIDLTNEKQQQQSNKIISDYILKHLSINIDSKSAALKYVGFEKESESIYCYFEVANLPSLKKVDITNSILQDYKEEQVNIMHVIVNGNRKSSKLDFPATQASFSF
jgi:hypothetical protein